MQKSGRVDDDVQISALDLLNEKDGRKSRYIGEVLERYRGEGAGDLKKSELNEFVENWTCFDALRRKIWKINSKILMDEKSWKTWKSKQKIVMNEDLVQNIVMDEELVQKVVMDEELVQNVVMDETFVRNFCDGCQNRSESCDGPVHIQKWWKIFIMNMNRGC